MAFVFRRFRRARRPPTLSRSLRRYFQAMLFILMGTFIIGVISYVATIVPEISLEIGDVSISNRLIIGLISWVAGILFVVTGIQRFGLRI
jgi:predicted membrane channel-forming protein YqfA (hemolysin III family)